jgi:beta-xylosidase
LPHIREIQIRDPFVFREEDTYYLFGSTDKDIWRAPAVGFDMYRSRGNLEEFEGPFPCFRPPENFWSAVNFWAPEVYKYRGEYYMFATFKPREGRRGTAVLKSPSLELPFSPWSAGPVTPPEWECLDGTLYVDRDGKPWMIFCHEWVQVGNGEICLIPLSDDLKAASAGPRLLFRAAEAPWAKPLPERPGRPSPAYVTDGPNMYTSENGDLLMLWSSFNEQHRYCIGVARSESGLVTGPWKQSGEPLYEADGGHGMFFRSLEGRLYLAVHSPNKTPRERPVFIEFNDEQGAIRRGGQVIA